MQIFHINYKSILIALLACTSCVTPAQKKAMQTNIRQLDEEVNTLRAKINTQLQQVERTTRTSLASYSELQNMQNQFQENLGEIDSLKMRVKKIEEMNSETAHQYAARIAANEETVIKLQRQLARMQLIIPENPHTLERAETPSKNVPYAKLKNAKDVSKYLAKDYEKGFFKTVVSNATSILQYSKSTPEMQAIALEFRGEAKFQLGDYKHAALDLSNYLEQNPSGTKAARAMLLLGDSYIYLKNQTAAVSYYNDCIKMFPNTPEGSACAARTEKLFQ